MRFAIPDFALVILTGPTGAGKSTLAARHFLPSEIISPDACRAAVSDDESDQAASGDAFDLLRHPAGLRGLSREGFRSVCVLDTPAEPDALEIVREPLWTGRRADAGPFDFIGDLHGCFDELTALLDRLGYRRDPFAPGETLLSARHPEGRRIVFLGDITDRGPRNLDCLRLVMGMCTEGSALCVMGNHDLKLSRWLAGRDVKLTHGLDLTAAELLAASPDVRAAARSFTDDLRSQSWLAGGQLVVAHAGLKEEMHGRKAPIGFAHVNLRGHFCFNAEPAFQAAKNSATASANG